MLKKTKTLKRQRKPYAEADYIEKVERNWKKASGLYLRGEYSVSIIRCATCLELAINFAIMKELVEKHELPLSYVRSLMKRANGITGKYQDLLLPLLEGDARQEFKTIWKELILPANKSRNDVVHRGEFRSKVVGKKTVENTHRALTSIFECYGVAPKLKLSISK